MTDLLVSDTTTDTETGTTATGTAAVALAAPGTTAPAVPFRSIHSHLTQRALRLQPTSTAVRAAYNEAPFTPIPAVTEAIASAAAGLNLYPEGIGTLEAKLAAHHGVEDLGEGCVVVSPGSGFMLHNLAIATCDPGDEVMFGWRSFDAYFNAAATAGAKAVAVPVLDNGALQLEAMTEAITDRTRLIVLCTPNNPSGAPLMHADVLDFLAKVPSNVLVVLDDAYGEYATAEGVVDGFALAAQFPNVAVLKTFSKFFGLAGLRLGYLIARPEITTGIRRISLLSGVSTLAVQAGLACLEPASVAEYEERRRVTLAERARIESTLVDQGFTIYPSQANFILIDLGEKSDDFAAFSAANGVIIRSYGEDGARYSIMLPEVNDLFLEITEKWQVEQA